MVFAGVDHVVVGLVVRHGINIYLVGIYATKKAIAHPMPKGRGLRSRLVKASGNGGFSVVGKLLSTDRRWHGA